MSVSPPSRQPGARTRSAVLVLAAALVRVTGTQRCLPLSGPLTVREDGRVVTRARLDAGVTWFRMPPLTAGTHHLVIALDGPRGPRTTTAADVVIAPAP